MGRCTRWPCQSDPWSSCSEPSGRTGGIILVTVAAGIVAWRAELDAAGDTCVVFKDSGFVDDVAKTNMAAILRQEGIMDVRSL